MSIAPEIDKGTNQVCWLYAQRLNGDTVGAKVTAEQARNTFDALCKDQPDNSFYAQQPVPCQCCDRETRKRH